MIERLTDRVSPWSPVVIVLTCALAPVALAIFALIAILLISCIAGGY